MDERESENYQNLMMVQYTICTQILTLFQIFLSPYHYNSILYDKE